MDYEKIDHLRRNHPAWKLLCADNVALILSFASRVFIEKSQGEISQSELASELEDEIWAINSDSDEGKFNRPPEAYLNDWASPDHGWLRKFYVSGNDEPHYDISPAVEKSLLWVKDLQQRDFIGTESRLKTIFDLLRQITLGADTNPEHHLSDLRRRRLELDEQIQRAEKGEVEILDPVAQRDRYQQFSRMARELLSDFREVEENFRRLDRDVRKQIAGWSGSKGEVIQEIINNRQNILQSDQGKSFGSFYDILLSHQGQVELTDLLHKLEDIKELPEHTKSMTRIQYEWLDASNRTQATVRRLSEQLSHFLSDRAWLENRRISELLRNVEQHALTIKEHLNEAPGMTIEEPKISISLPFERPIYKHQVKIELENITIQKGDTNIDTSKLYSQTYVDKIKLINNIKKHLKHSAQIDLISILNSSPLEHGLAELVTYMSLNDPHFSIIFDEESPIKVKWGNNKVVKTATLPRITYTTIAKQKL